MVAHIEFYGGGETATFLSLENRVTDLPISIREDGACRSKEDELTRWVRPDRTEKSLTRSARYVYEKIKLREANDLDMRGRDIMERDRFILQEFGINDKLVWNNR